MSAAIVGVFGALAVALIGASVGYFSSRRLSQRNEQLARIDRQLSEFYGPMFAMLEANRRAYETLVRVYGVGSPEFFRAQPRPPTEQELRLWREWVCFVFQPVLRRVYELIVSKADLLIERKIPDCLIDFCAHSASMEVVIAQWNADDYSVYTAAVPRPGTVLDEYVAGSFTALKLEQERLLALTGHKRGRAAGSANREPLLTIERQEGR